MRPLKILVADDHPVVREGIKQILARTNEMVVEGEAGDGRELFERAAAGAWDAVVLDLSMPGDGLELLKKLKHDYPHMPVLVLSVHPEDQFAVRALRAGASGYMTKESAPTELVSALRKVVEGHKYISEWLAEKLASSLDSDYAASPHERLSDREYQVLRMIASGKSTKNIASELALSAKTVGTYRSRILDKMGMQNDAELIAYAIRAHLAGLIVITSWYRTVADMF